MAVFTYFLETSYRTMKRSHRSAVTFYKYKRVIQLNASSTFSVGATSLVSTVALEVTSTTPHSTSVTPLPPLLTPPLSLYFRQFHRLGSTHFTPRPQSIRRGVGGATSIARCSLPNSSVFDGSGSGSGKRGRLVSILEKCLLSGNEDKLMRVIESVVPSANMPLSRLLGSLLVLLPSTSVLLPFWLKNGNSPTASLLVG